MVDRAEWERRFKARIMERLTATQVTDENPEGAWTAAEAEEVARNEFDNVEIELDASPEASADECLSYWGDGA